MQKYGQGGLKHSVLDCRDGSVGIGAATTADHRSLTVKGTMTTAVLTEGKGYDAARCGGGESSL